MAEADVRSNQNKTLIVFAYTEGLPMLPIKSVNVVFCGESRVGKTSIVKRYVHDYWVATHTGTTGMEFNIHNGLPQEGEPQYEVKLNIWDMGAGLEQYRNTLRDLHASFDVICFVFDATDSDTLDRIFSTWLEAARWTLQGRKWGVHDRSAPTVAYLVANKCEDAAARTVSRELALGMATAHGLRYAELSAKTKEGTAEFFQALIAYVHDAEHIEGEFDALATPREQVEVTIEDVEGEVIEFRRTCCCWMHEKHLPFRPN